MKIACRSTIAVLTLLCVSGVCPAGEAVDFTKIRVTEPNGVVRYSEPILSADPALGELRVYNPTVIPVKDRLAMLYRVDARGSHGSRIQLAFSDDGRTFTPYASNPVLTADSPFDQYGCEDPRVTSIGGVYYMTYIGDTDKDHKQQCVCVATSTDLTHWDKKGVAFTPSRAWDKQQAKAAVIVPEKVGGKYVMYFIGETVAWHTSIGMAVSDDLVHWTEPLDHFLMTARPDRFDSLGVECGATPVLVPQGILLIYNGWNPCARPPDRLGVVLEGRPVEGGGPL